MAGAQDGIPRVAIKLPGIILGVGLGGFFDGILLHQLLQWHHMFSSIDDVDTVPGLRMNTLGDGLFHTVTWLSVLIGLGMLYSRVAESRRAVWGSSVLWGWIIVGWGAFNLVEGVVDHQILGIHHVRQGPHQLAWDLGFLLSGVVLMLVGWAIQRAGKRGWTGDPAAVERARQRESAAA
jgi:uncharacterized membrane protein